MSLISVLIVIISHLIINILVLLMIIRAAVILNNFGALIKTTITLGELYFDY